MNGSIHHGLGLASMIAAATALAGCTSDDCKSEATAIKGMCLPKCPSVQCGDKVCTRYVWDDGLFNDDLRCETHLSCPGDCSDADLSLSRIITFAVAKIDSSSFVPNPAQNVSVSGSCSDGGQVSVTGSRGCLTVGGVKTCSHDMTYAFSGCVYLSAYPEGRITLASGSLREQWGYTDTGSGSGPAVYAYSGQVTVSGTLSVGYVLDRTVETISQSNCAVNFANNTGAAGIVGTMCGRTILSPTYVP